MKPINTANNELIKKMNTNAILNVIRSKASISRADIAKMLKLNPATVSSNVSDLIDLGLIQETGSGSSSGGRKPILLELNAKNNFIIGVHTELTHVNVGVMDMNGMILAIKAYNFHGINHANHDNVMETILLGISDIIKHTKISKEKIIGIGVGLHGIVDSHEGKSVFAPAFHWHNVPIRNMLYDKFNKTVIIDNDVRVMALGEKWFGKAKTSDNFMLINLGEGIGGALFINGQLYYGKSFGAGEIGHIKVSQKPLQCDCGNKGCLTTLASEEGIVNRMQEIVENKKMAVYGLEAGERVTFKKILEAANTGDQTAIKLLEQTGDYIGRSIGIIINMINPEQIILTGSVICAKKYLMPSIKGAAEAASIFDNFVKTKITVSSIEEHLGVIGASTLILNDLFAL
jgi:predicted NBD/HSP70 family sugar kinase